MSGFTTIELSGGRHFNYEDPSECIDLRDIAKALSHCCRFAGHVLKYYSVAEHALLVRRIVRDYGRGDLALAALHHDSHEAYVGDIPTPLKNAINQAQGDMVDRIDNAIAEWLGINPLLFHHDVVKRADYTALFWEATKLKDSAGSGEHWNWDLDKILCPVPDDWKPGMSPVEAKWAFAHAHVQDHGRAPAYA